MPEIADFEREYRVVLAEQERVAKIVVTSLAKPGVQIDTKPYVQAFITILRGDLTIASPFINDAISSIADLSEDSPIK